jgi:hypothetical protein
MANRDLTGKPTTRQVEENLQAKEETWFIFITTLDYEQGISHLPV